MRSAFPNALPCFLCVLVMSRMAEPVVLSDVERATITRWARGKRTPLRLVQRAPHHSAGR